MSAPKSNSNLVFDYKTLRLIVGVLAFAFPAVAIARSGKITTSISASYWEPGARDFFVGFLFVIGALFVSYKGHLQVGTGKLKWLTKYQEDVISTIGGIAAIFTALNPTARDGAPMDTHAYIHMAGAFILFASVVYFCVIAFLRSVNQKLLENFKSKEDNQITNQIKPDDILGFTEDIKEFRKKKSRIDINLFARFWNFLFLEMSIFRILTSKVFAYEDEKGVKESLKVSQVFSAEVKRGWVYVVCGSIIIIDLLTFIILQATLSDLVTNSKTTFVIETIALVPFGIAWLKASQFDFWSPIKERLQSWRTPASTTN